MVNSVAMQCNNRAAVFSMRSVPATIGKLFILYRPMLNSVAKQRWINTQQWTANRGILVRVFFVVRSPAIYQRQELGFS
jgi:hypothetical protein